MIGVWAHRGARLVAPENTLPAFAAALAAGADGVEFDVQLSRDGHPVVIHDETVDRTTDGSGMVRDLTLAQLQELDAAAGMAGIDGARIPQLGEVLQLLAGTGLGVNVELKNSVVDYPGLEQTVLAAVADAGMTGPVVYSSFSRASVAQLATLTRSGPAEATVGLLWERPLLRPLRLARDLGARAVHPPARLVPGAGWVNRAHGLGLAVRPWVVNGEAAVRRARRLGVDAFFTDDPTEALALRNQDT